MNKQQAQEILKADPHYFKRLAQRSHVKWVENGSKARGFKHPDVDASAIAKLPRKKK